MLSRKAKHPAIAEEKTICSMAGFFASLRFAQNDKLLYSLTNEELIITDVIVSVGLSNIVYRALKVSFLIGALAGLLEWQR
jgi:hypothetical protein